MHIKELAMRRQGKRDSFMDRKVRVGHYVEGTFD
jgi:hypothetical protein